MAIGDVTLTHYGSVNVSGSELKTLVDSLNINPITAISGAGLRIIPTGQGQVMVLGIEVASA